MTLVDAPKAMPDVDEVQLLFQEAKERRRRRWLVSGITAVVVVVLVAVSLGIALGTRGGGTVKPAVPAIPAPATAHSPVSLSFRPVLCNAPPLTLAAGQTASEGPLPSCSPASQLTASNLSVDPSTGAATANPPTDAQFSSYPSTAASSGGVGGTVLLPGVPGQGGTRFVLGPAALTQQGITAARAVDANGQWMVDLTLSAAGSTQWDSLTAQQFHALVAVVVNGKVISTPLVQPSQTSFTSFGGHLQVAGAFTEGQAKAMAAGL